MPIENFCCRFFLFATQIVSDIANTTHITVPLMPVTATTATMLTVFEKKFGSETAVSATVTMGVVLRGLLLLLSRFVPLRLVVE